MNDVVLLFDIFDDAVFVFFGQEWQILQSPFLVADIILLRVDHLNQMTDAPCDDVCVVFYVTIVFS